MRMPMPQGILPSLVDQPRIGRPYFRREQRVLPPPIGRIDVEVGRHDVEVAEANDRRIQFD